MIIDAHAHVGEFEHYGARYAELMIGSGRSGRSVWWDPTRTWTPQTLPTDIPRFVRHLDEFGIDRAIIWGFLCIPHGSSVPAEYVADIVRQHPDRFIGFHSPDPLGGWRSVQEVERAANELRLRGLKMFQPLNNIAIDDERALPIYAKAEELGLVVTIQAGWSRTPGSHLELHRPIGVDRVAMACPNLRIVIAHGGWPWVDETYAIMFKHPNVYTDTSDWCGFMTRDSLARALATAKHLGLLNRVLWGSDYPLFSPARDLDLFRSLPAYTAQHDLQPVLTDDDIQAILGNNAAHLLGLA